MRALSIPVEVGDVTPEWLAQALDVPVAGVTVLDRHSGTTGRLRLALSYADGARPRSPATVFIKLPPFDEGQRGFVKAIGMGVAEARFYRDLAAEVPMRVPRVWYAAIDADDNYVMVLEDLIASGCRFPRLRDADIADLARRIVEDLAALHARFWQSERFATDLAWLAGRGTGGADGGAPFVERVLEHLGDALPPGFRDFAGDYLPRAGGMEALWNDGPCTLVHGDPHLGNLFVDSARPGFLDWAMIGRAPGLRDVAYVLCSSIPPDVRRAHERDWLRDYVERINGAGVDLDFDAAWDQYRLFAVYAWLAVTSTAAMGSLWQPERIGVGGMQRATAAVIDLDSIGLIRERLTG